MIELLRELHTDGVTVMLIEHIMTAVLALSERLLVMHEGAQLALGEPRAVVDDPVVIEAYLGEDYA
jgi:branched-chain amino acid transport system ATP-binding protein